MKFSDSSSNDKDGVNIDEEDGVNDNVEQTNKEPEEHTTEKKKLVAKPH